MQNIVEMFQLTTVICNSLATRQCILKCRSDVSRKNHTGSAVNSSVAEPADKGMDVLRHKSKRGQVVKQSEYESRSRYPTLVPQRSTQRDSFGEGAVRRDAQRTHQLQNAHQGSRARTCCLRPEENDARKSKCWATGVFALTADTSWAHRQVPLDPGDWHLSGRQVCAGGDIHIKTVGTFGVASASPSGQEKPQQSEYCVSILQD